MRERILIRNADAVVTCDPADRVLYNSDILICGNRIEAVGNNLAAGDAQIIDAAGKYVYPGLVNTHHHFFQAFVRNLMTIDRSELTLMQWLDDIYKVFVRIDGDVIFYASAACMADLIKHGCTCSVDHQYCYTPATGKQGVDRQMEAARLMGFRFVAARGTNTLPRWKGSTIPDEMCETTAEYLDDCQRLLALYHDPEPFSMRQIVLAPCQPINCTEDTFLETIRLARSAGVHMHTHLCEGENSSMVRRFGVRSLEWCRRIGFVGSDIWLAHGRETLPENMLCWRKTTWAFPTAPPPPCWAAARFWTSPVCARPAYP
jgi:hydroxyatrazine ethylaminohydrolase